MAKVGKRLKKIYSQVDLEKIYPLAEAVKTVRANAVAKFDETIEIALNLNVDPRKADQNIRGVVQLPEGTGKTVKVAVFCREAKAKEAKEAGADIVGAEELADQILAGKIDFDRCIATPDMMGVVGRLGKVLGPRGLMPNPKLGTVTADVAAAVKAVKGGQVEYRNEKAGIIHGGIGKASFTDAQIENNLKAFAVAVLKARPAGVKGQYLQGAALGSTMGAAIKLDMAELQALAS